MDELERLLAMSKEQVMAKTLSLPELRLTQTQPIRQRRHKRLAVWGGVAAGVVVLSGFTMPSLLHIGKKFNLLTSQMSPREVHDSVVQGYGQKVSQSVTSNGITLTIGNIFADPLQFEFDMVESFTKQAKSHPVVSDNDIDLTLNGTEKLYNFSGGDFQMADGHRYAGVVYMPMANIEPFQPLPVHFMLNVHISQIGDVKGNWNFSIPVSGQKMRDASRILQPRTVKSDGSRTFTVSDVTIEPNQTIIQTDLSRQDGKDEYPGGMFPVGGADSVLVTDEHHHSLNGSLVGMPSSSTVDGRQVYHLTVRADKLPKSTKEIRITPLVGQKMVDAPLTGHLPMTINGPFGAVQVSDVEFLSDKTLVHLSMDDKTYEGQQLQQFVLTYTNQSGTIGTPMKRIISNDVARHELTAEFSKLNPKQHYSIQLQGVSPLSSLMITVPVQH